ncbi:hypothetical protein Sjap_000903 [Stephania japonica]|uniref:tRNA-intron lyase n=1 Tax=Stephania japonica TaxID=461633 RepID=A0AAP0KKJ4_9MAGN
MSTLCGINAHPTLKSVSNGQCGLHLLSMRPIVNADADKQWFQLSLEEAFYLSNDLNSLKIIGDDKCPKSYDKVWRYMMSKKSMFPDFYKAYSHLRTKNWVVRSGSQYGVDFVAYRHHPALVHSEYAVIVTSEDANEENPQLKVWSDFHCTIRLCGSVTKTLLVLNIKKNDQDASLPSCLERFNVGELTIKRWNPDRCRENKLTIENGPEHQGRVRGLGFEATPSSVGATA